jgi:hypothetical protein
VFHLFAIGNAPGSREIPSDSLLRRSKYYPLNLRISVSKNAKIIVENIMRWRDTRNASPSRVFDLEEEQAGANEYPWAPATQRFVLAVPTFISNSAQIQDVRL